MLLLLLDIRYAAATSQVPDRLRFQGKEYLLHSNPLEEWLAKKKQRPAELTKGSTACWRGYQATWQLENGQLFLLEVKPGCDEKKAAIDLEQWFQLDTKGRVAADWVEGTLDVPLGKLLRYEHLGYESIYEKDWLLTFRRGRLVGQRTYRNQVNKLPDEDFTAQLYRAIDWQKILKQPAATYRVFVQFTPDSTGKSCRVVIQKSAGDPYDAVALQAARQVASRDWGATYRFGRWRPLKWVTPITFSEDNRRRFAK
ncbi:hypothetical protein [Hymenobacter sp. DG01]|uniref:hypothetical protein n=1 Tax=Hymenobacter sp. DG01 TaxID=2584940 RepID=UPI001121617F|nr:hypothetical protein [Hymenobacter sp. DG01]